MTVDPKMLEFFRAAASSTSGVVLADGHFGFNEWRSSLVGLVDFYNEWHGMIGAAAAENENLFEKVAGLRRERDLAMTEVRSLTEIVRALRPEVARLSAGLEFERSNARSLAATVEGLRGQMADRLRSDRPPYIEAVDDLKRLQDIATQVVWKFDHAMGAYGIRHAKSCNFALDSICMCGLRELHMIVRELAESLRIDGPTAPKACALCGGVH